MDESGRLTEMLVSIQSELKEMSGKLQGLSDEEALVVFEALPGINRRILAVEAEQNRIMGTPSGAASLNDRRGRLRELAGSIQADLQQLMGKAEEIRGRFLAMALEVRGGKRFVDDQIHLPKGSQFNSRI